MVHSIRQKLVLYIMLGMLFLGLAVGISTYSVQASVESPVCTQVVAAISDTGICCPFPG
ncbi:MAG: hypothetical protein GY943_26485 [Chloroflexi bacterium]|nr:hypothetical protein [Chloroflexota bacterium]